MPVRTVSGAVYSAIAWMPILVFVVAVAWVLAVGVLNLELYSSGTSFLLSDETNLSVRDLAGGAAADPATGGQGADAAQLQAALDSGDTDRMQAALAAAG